VLSLKVALVGCGAIGTTLAKAIEGGDAGKAELAWIFDVRRENCQALAKQLRHRPAIAEHLEDILADGEVELVIEAASQMAVAQYAVKILGAGKDLMVMSVGAFADERLFKEVCMAAVRTKHKIYVPSGAILGIDGVKAARLAGIDEVVLTTRKPPAALAYSEYLKKQGIGVAGLKTPLIVFEGSARDAVKAFPKSVNVAATLSLAGIGLDRTKVCVVADPSLDRNVHELRVRGKAGEFVVKARNVPSPENPKTSYLAALSAIHTLRRITEAVCIGT
jgi:aspartate dehydrogenase